MCAHNELGGMMPGMATLAPDNKGQHIVHAGGSYTSYVQLSVKALS